MDKTLGAVSRTVLILGVIAGICAAMGLAASILVCPAGTFLGFWSVKNCTLDLQIRGSPVMMIALWFVALGGFCAGVYVAIDYMRNRA